MDATPGSSVRPGRMIVSAAENEPREKSAPPPSSSFRRKATNYINTLGREIRRMTVSGVVKGAGAR